MPLTASALAVAELAAGRTALTTLRSRVPLSLRPTADGLTVVSSAFGPLGGDRTELVVRVGPGAQLRVGSAGAQVAQPGVTDPVSRSRVQLSVAAGGELHWQLEPLVVTAGAEHRAELHLDVEPGGRAVVVETVVLGRTPDAPGRYRSRWRTACGDEPLFAADLDVGAGAPDGWDGPAVLGTGRVLVTALVVGADLPDEAEVAGLPGGCAMRLAGPGVLLSRVGRDTVEAERAVRRFLDETAYLMPVRATPSTK